MRSKKNEEHSRKREKRIKVKEKGKGKSEKKIKKKNGTAGVFLQICGSRIYATHE
ncbi:hypothetical protein [Methanosarcina sp.]|uniref:hypothetical protein n=1 Tax=Methanosarcina sp. TaxID=2213 RepID=UPI003C73AF75